MVKLKQLVFLIGLLMALKGCITPIEPESIAFDDLMVIEGLLTTSTKHAVKLSRTSPINSKESHPVSGATVKVVVDGQLELNFVEEEPGYYANPIPYAARSGVDYVLKISTSDGHEYESTAAQLVEVPQIDSVYTQFVPDPENTTPFVRNIGTFNIYLDVRNNITGTRAFRYRWSEAYKLKVPNPSRWKWLGGDQFEFRPENVPELQEEICYRQDSSASVILGESISSNGEILKFPIHSFEAKRQLNVRYSFEAVQYGLSDESEKYWKAIASSSQSQGSLFDVQPGITVGNIKSTTDPDETVLGIFEVSEEKRYRVYYYASDFVEQGYRTYTDVWLDCDQELIVTPNDEAGSFMESNYPKYELLYYITGGGAVFGVRSCALCTLYGTNVKPPYWKD